jgi:hypothetical protein
MALQPFTPRLRRLKQILNSPRAQNLQISVLAAIIMLLGLVLTFYNEAYLFLSKYAVRPELLPLPLLVVLIWTVLQVALMGREADKSGTQSQVLSAIRHEHLQEWILSRHAMVDFFGEASRPLKRWASVGDATSTLAQWILSAQPNVRLEILAFSTETFLQPCIDAAREIAVSKAHLDQVDIRILVRDPSTQWLIPYIADQRADEEYVRDLKARFQQARDSWEGLILSEFAKVLPASKIRLEMKVYPFEPVFKGIVVDRRVGLVGVYPVDTTTWRDIRDVWDYLGHKAPMVEISKTAKSPFGASLFEMFLRWFDTLWRISRPVKPSR